MELIKWCLSGAPFLHSEIDFLCKKKMSQNLENCHVGVENKLGVVRPATEEYAEEAIEALKAQKVIAVPTDTLYGFACDAWYVILTGSGFSY